MSRIYCKWIKNDTRKVNSFKAKNLREEDTFYRSILIIMKNRIDKELVNRNLVPSRSKAQELIESNFVKCNDKIINKCNYMVLEEDNLSIIENDRKQLMNLN